MSTSPAKTHPVWRSFLQIFVAYVLGVWTLLQFLEWMLTRAGISPYWVDLVLWINLGLLPSLLLYFRHHQRMNDLLFKRWEKFFVGGNVLLLLLVLIFSFRGKDFGSTTKDVTYVAADGREEIRRITKSDFRIPCAIFNFRPAPGSNSDSLQWLGDGVRELIALDLQQDKSLTVQESYADATAAEKLKRTKLYEFYFDGTYGYERGEYCITPAVNTSGNGKVIAEKSFRGQDLLALIDSISVYLRTQIGISEDAQRYLPDLPLREYTTDSLRALQYFCQSNNAGMENALRIDPEFTLASAYMGRWKLKAGTNSYERDLHLNRALTGRGKLPVDLAQEVLTNWHIANGDLAAAEASLNIQLQVEPDNQAFNQQMIDVLSLGKRYEDLLAFTESINNKYFSEFTAIKYGDAMLVNHQFREVLNKLKPIKAVLPNDPTVLDYSFKAELLARRWADAAETLQKMQAIFPEYQAQLSYYERALKNHQAANGDIPGWEVLLGKQQILGTERINEYSRNPNGGLTFSNNSGQVLIPILLNKDTSLLGGFFYLDVSKNNVMKGKLLTKTFVTLRGPNLVTSDLQWRYAFAWPDALQAAENDLKAGRYQEAKAKYLEVRAAYPTHFFIDNALAHIDYVTKIGPAAYQEQIAKLVGTSSSQKTTYWMDQGRLYFKQNASDNKAFTTLDLLPIAEDTFISLTSKTVRYALALDNGKPRVTKREIYSVEKQVWE